MWVLDHLADVTSDLSAIHGIRDANEMEATVFFQFAARLAAYPGVVAARYNVAQHPAREQGAAKSAAPPPLTAEALAGINERLRSVGQQGIGYTKVEV